MVVCWYASAMPQFPQAWVTTIYLGTFFLRLGWESREPESVKEVLFGGLARFSGREPVLQFTRPITATVLFCTLRGADQSESYSNSHGSGTGHGAGDIPSGEH